MSAKKAKSPEPKQRTPKGKEIPVPSKRRFFGDLGKAIRKQEPESPSERDQGKR